MKKQIVYKVNGSESALDWIRYKNDLSKVKEFIEDEIESRDLNFTYEDHLRDIRHNRSIEDTVRDEKIIFDIIDSFIEEHMSEEEENRLKFEDLENTLDRYLGINFHFDGKVCTYGREVELEENRDWQDIDSLRDFLCTEMVREATPILTEYSDGTVEIKVPFGDLGGGSITHYTLEGRL